jgi:hypothetical protein
MLSLLLAKLLPMLQLLFSGCYCCWQCCCCRCWHCKCYLLAWLLAGLLLLLAGLLLLLTELLSLLLEWQLLLAWLMLMQDAVGRPTVAAAGRAGDAFARAATAACL